MVARFVGEVDHGEHRTARHVVDEGEHRPLARVDIGARADAELGTFAEDEQRSLNQLRSEAGSRC